MKTEVRTVGIETNDNIVKVPIENSDSKIVREPVVLIGGGSEPILESITITENGTYTPPENVDGYNEIVVNVEGGYTPTKEGLIFELDMEKNGWIDTVSNVDFKPLSTGFNMNNTEFFEKVDGGRIVTPIEIIKDYEYIVEIDINECTNRGDRVFIGYTVGNGYSGPNYRSGSFGVYGSSGQSSFGISTNPNYFDGHTMKFKIKYINDLPDVPTAFQWCASMYDLDGVEHGGTGSYNMDTRNESRGYLTLLGGATFYDWNPMGTYKAIRIYRYKAN